MILDGAADEPCNVLGDKTPLEAAKTPFLDSIAKKSKINYCFTVKEGVAPESSSAVVSLLGYDYQMAPRGPLEAMGARIPFKKGDLVLRCNFATVDDLNKSSTILDSRAGRTLTTKEARVLAKAINVGVKSDYPFEFYPTREHRGVLVFKGGFSDNISNADPFYGEGSAKNVLHPKMVWAKALDEDDGSDLSAEIVNRFIRMSHEVLDKHPTNVSRGKKGLYSANMLICRDAGNEVVKFKKIKGKWMALGYNPLEIGIAKSVGMDLYTFRYPKLKSIDIYGNLYKGLRKSIKYAIKMLKKYENKQDYFYIHFKETDIPGHDNKPLDKLKMIEMIDYYFFSFMTNFLKGRKLVVTADHTTSCRKKAHTADAVPVLYYSGIGENNETARFTEKDGLNGKKIIGKNLLEKTFFAD